MKNAAQVKCGLDRFLKQLTQAAFYSGPLGRIFYRPRQLGIFWQVTLPSNSITCLHIQLIMASELCNNTERYCISKKKYKTWTKIVANGIQEIDVQKHHYVMTLVFQDVMNEMLHSTHKILLLHSEFFNHIGISS